jgi:hypothetical protein
MKHRKSGVPLGATKCYAGQSRPEGLKHDFSDELEEEEEEDDDDDDDDDTDKFMSLLQEGQSLLFLAIFEIVQLCYRQLDGKG